MFNGRKKFSEHEQRMQKLAVKEAKWNCKKQGHDYEVVDCNRVVDSPKKNVVGLWLYVECKNCKKRKTIRSEYGTCNEINSMWEYEEISMEKRKELIEILGTKWKKYQKEEKPKANKPVKKAKAKGGK